MAYMLSSLYVVEETAMVIRIEELGDKRFFYCPQDEIIKTLQLPLQ